MNKAFFEPVDRYLAKPRLFVDSGAFSAYNSGAIIDLDDYAAYLANVKAEMFAAASLDVIAGPKDRRPTPDESELASVASYDNWRRLRADGIATIPVFHQGDERKWLFRYLDDGATYIGVSPNNTNRLYPPRVWQEWLYAVLWELDQVGGLNREFFVHGFGVFSPPLLPQLEGRMWSSDAKNLSLHSSNHFVMLPYDRHDQLTIHGPWARQRLIYVGRRRPDLAPKDFDWTEFAEYIMQLRQDVGFLKIGDRYVARSVYPITSLNIHAVRLIARAAGVRMFVTSTDDRVIYQLSHERYPYLLKSFAFITERTGSTIWKLYHRTILPPKKLVRGMARRISGHEQHTIC